MSSAGLFFNGIKSGMNSFAKDISIIINTILLLIVYLIAVGFTSVLSKIMGKNFLSLKPDKKRDSYWLLIKPKEVSHDDYYKQF
jgi:hypothetical protein